MAKSPTDPESGRVTGEQECQDALEMDELRRLIAGRERSQIDQLRERLENPELRIKDVSQILAEAIVHRTSQDEKIAKALAPTVEKRLNLRSREIARSWSMSSFPSWGRRSEKPSHPPFTE